MFTLNSDHYCKRCRRFELINASRFSFTINNHHHVHEQSDKQNAGEILRRFTNREATEDMLPKSKLTALDLTGNGHLVFAVAAGVFLLWWSFNGDLMVMVLTKTGWWFACHFWHFPRKILGMNHHPNWRSPSFFRGVAKNHQPEKYWFNGDLMEYCWDTMGCTLLGSLSKLSFNDV